MDKLRATLALYSNLDAQAYQAEHKAFIESDQNGAGESA